MQGYRTGKILSLCLMALGQSVAIAQDYPSKPIRIVTGGAGGSSDFTTRLVAQGIVAALGQQVIVDNRVSGAPQGDLVAKSAPDGYTLLITGGTFYTFPLLQKAPYDVMRDFSTITFVERSVSLLAIHPSLPSKSVKELVALAKSRPGELNFSSSGRGGTAHLAGELFRSMAGVNIVHVPYKGTAPALNALIGGEVQIMINSTTVMTPHQKSGRVRALAVATLEPTVLAPGLPTVAASGVPGYESVAITGMFAPARTPEAIIKRMNEIVVRHLNTPEVKEKLFNIGSEIIGDSPEQFLVVLKRDIDRTAKLIKELGLRIE